MYYVISAGYKSDTLDRLQHMSSMRDWHSRPVMITDMVSEREEGVFEQHKMPGLLPAMLDAPVLRACACTRAKKTLFIGSHDSDSH